MKIIIVVKEQSEFFREATDWQADFKKETGHTAEILDPETIEGEIFVRARDIVRYPTVVVVSDDGQILEKFDGTPLPQFDRILYIMRDM